MKTELIRLIAKITTDEVGVPALDGNTVLTNALNIAYFIAGAVAAITLIVGGLMYSGSGGNAANVTKAKNLVLYAIVGLVVITSAWAITNFVIGAF